MRRKMLRIGLVLGIVLPLLYAAACWNLYENQRGLLYFPQGTRVAAADTDFSLRNGGVVLRGWVRHPGRPKAVIYFGGNAESLAAGRDDLAALFPDRTVYLLAYRGYGASDGSPDQQGLFSDALALYDAVRPKHAAVAVVGRSLGSGVACYLVSQRPVERLALVTPFDSMVRVAQAHYPLFPMDLIAKERFESSSYIAGYRGPVLVLRAGRDAIVPQDSTDRLIAAMAVKPVVKTWPNAGHNSISESEDYDQALSDFMK